MANIKIIGNAYIIESTRTLEDIRTLEKYAPKALRLYEKDEETGKNQEVFCIGSTCGSGSINKIGFSFGQTAKDGSGHACITTLFPAGLDVEDPKEWIAEKIGYAIVNLNKVEEQFDAALADVNARKAEVLENITIA